MYLVSVPINCYKFHRTENKQLILDELREFNAERVMLNFESKLDGHIVLEKKEEYQKQLRYMEEACTFFKQHGFEVGAWFWGLQFDESLDFTPIKTLHGNCVKKFACPSDEKFLEVFEKCLCDVSKTGVDIILLNDDLRYGAWGDVGCICENHMKMICEQLGEAVEETQLKDLILNGGKNKYRDALLKANKISLMNYARRMRSAVDKVNQNIRLGFCACMTSWDIDGDAFELSRVFAGETKPILRLIGAPYWAVRNMKNNRLQDVVELERMEASWNKYPDIELIAEGDAYPRPRLNCGVNYLEGFDTAIRASGAIDGILKICIDYVSDVGYESGYLKKCIKNKPLYREIEKHFSNKKSCGIRVYESMKKVETMQIPNALGLSSDVEEVFYSSAARVLAANAIPTVYDGDGVTAIAFGENAYHLANENFRKGMIIDALAAKILTDRGIDVGVEFFGEEKKCKYQFICCDENYIIADNCSAFDVKLNPDCEILSYATNDFENHETPLCYLYQNRHGQKFLVFNCIAKNSETFLKEYCNAKIIADSVEWLSGEKLPGCCCGNPNLYMQCKEDEEHLVIGLWNFFEDEVIEPVVNLGQEYQDCEFLFCSGLLSKDKVVLTDIPPFGFCAIVLKKQQVEGGI